MPKTKTASLRSKPAGRKKAAKPKPATQEQLLAAIGKLQDEATDVMRKPHSDFVIRNPHAFTALYNLARKYDEAWHRLDELINPEHDWNGPDADALVNKALSHTLGEVPPWGRPGRFLMWVDYVPVLCQWTGILRPWVHAYAADPYQNWLDSSGFTELQVLYVRAAHATPADLFRTGLITTGAKMTLSPLDEDALKAASENLAAEESAWLREALARGPVSPVPLPRHLRAVQRKLFD